MTRLQFFGRCAVAAVVAVACAAPGPAAADDGWVVTGPGITSGISGIAEVDPGRGSGELLAVHDNKHAGEPRVSRLRIGAAGAAEVRRLRWDGPRLPVDLEALSDVPGRPGEFVALESSGRGYHLRLRPRSVRVVREFTVPGVAAGETGEKGENYESFALVRQGGRLIAVWAHRGQDADPAGLRLARLEWPGLRFGVPRSVQVTVPYPSERVRHISDADITVTGRLVTAAASDPGDDGPFRSAVYDLGRVRVGTDGEPSPYLRERPVRLGVFGGHKVEAVACGADASTAVLGTDDENLGGWVRSGDVCG
ncbi:hypothetical protein AB0G74_24210 [Streptomyces sp. NPDC020875]|uniref:hypothetical protein n=1 Tax=Streptomyces sp. NPDC020875 TaxID=3154898 RepID=UPI0033D61139